jgi:hypothetical protein
VRWAEIPRPFLGNGSLNTCPLLGSRFLIMQQLDYNSERAIFSMVLLSGYKQDEVWSLVHSEFVQESVKRGFECIKLKNLHCIEAITREWLKWLSRCCGDL